MEELKGVELEAGKRKEGVVLLRYKRQRERDIGIFCGALNPKRDPRKRKRRWSSKEIPFPFIVFVYICGVFLYRRMFTSELNIMG